MILEDKTGFVPDFGAVGCFVETNLHGRLCILQLLRNSDRRIEPARWGAPAGRMNLEENPEEAMLRELKEETGLIIFGSQLCFTDVFAVAYPQSKFYYHVFRLCFPYAPEIVISREHVAHVWIPPEYAVALHLMQDEFECIRRVYKLQP